MKARLTCFQACATAWLLGAATILHAAADDVPQHAALPGGVAPWARPEELAIISRLRGVVGIADPHDKSLAVQPDWRGLDASRTPLLQGKEVEEVISVFLDKPASIPSLERLAMALRFLLRARGEEFCVVYVPPQDVTEGIVRIVAHRSRLEGELRIEGAKWFSAASYRTDLPIAAAAEIDPAALRAGVERINNSPYRRARLAAEEGSAPGTTRLTLQVQEQRPWRLSAGYSNSGTAVTDEDRLTTSVAWGNAFGRGDQFGYTFSADPDLQYSRSHSANYTTVFRSRRSLTFYGAHAEIESELPEPLTQSGMSWQLGARFNLPMKELRGWTQSAAFTADFKASDNNLEFAAIPITDNLTHVAQFGASWSFSRNGAKTRGSVAASVFVSPGGLTDRNHGRYFDVSRPGAKADYVYGQLQAHVTRELPLDFSWSMSGVVQLADGPLLGTEQINGGGAYGVRGYRESTAFGDEGVMVNNELRLPAFSPFRARDRATIFAFLDAAALRNRGPGGSSTELAAAGIGLDYQLRQNFMLRAAYGWQLRRLPNDSGGNSHGHIAATVAF